MPNHRKTKIIGTLGPASSDENVLRQMILNGLNIVRLNASHNSDADYIRGQVEMIRRLANEVKKTVGIFLDLQGPKIRVGKVKEGSNLVEKEVLWLTTEDIIGDEKRVSISYKGLYGDIQIGEKVFINDGAIKLEVIAKENNEIGCQVIQGGLLSNFKGVNLPHTKLTLSTITEKDKADALVAIQNDLDFVALSFVSDAETLHTFRRYLVDNGGKFLRIISKIERQQAMDNILEIIDASDAIMVARGDLGVEIGLEYVPEAQKRIIYESNRRVKPVIVATQMLETMIEKRNATRAEVSDVANAIYDRCDAVMLSGETAVGIDPAHVIATMNDICTASDIHMAKMKTNFGGNYTDLRSIYRDITSSFAVAADQLATENDVQALLVFTNSGKSPIKNSKLNPRIRIIAVTDSPKALTQMTLLRGVNPVLTLKNFTEYGRWTDMIWDAVELAKQQDLLKPGDNIISTAGIPIVKSGGTNSIRFLQVK